MGHQVKKAHMRYLIFIILLVAALFFAGCVSESKVKVTPAITSPVLTPLPAPVTSAQIMVKTTTVATTRPATTKTTLAGTEVPSKPIASPVTVNGTSGRIMRFSTDAPGIVKFTIHYAGNYDARREGCAKDDRAFIRLAGSSIDTSLYNGEARSTYSGTKTYNLIAPGNYSLSTQGCFDWKVTIDNA